MPIVHVYGFSRSIAKKRKVVEGITNAVAKAYGVSKETVIVYLIDIPPENSANTGILASDLPNPPKKKARKVRRK